ncbi:hypothetical protein [Winogradskyella sediminis]|uniref:hypothetical protein n=1 Tax=Winogradskyella sediminis TaxID=1382466 RepID=UPI003AA8C10E
MKTKLLSHFSKLFILIILMVACSSSDDSSPETNQPNTATQLIDKIIPENPESWEKGAQFFYQNDKLKYVYLDNCNGELYYFEYNDEGKVSKRYYDVISFEGEEFNPNNYDLSSLIQSGTPLNYIYQNGNLVKMQYTDDFVDYQFSYDNDNKVEVVEWILRDIGLWQKVVFTYSNDKISAMNKKQFNTSGGSVVSNYDYTFEYDNKQNPFYTLADSFSTLGIYTCTGFDYISSEDIGLKLFKNNVTKVYRGGVELFSATYQYNDNNYPTRISYTNTNGNNSGVDLITYLE